MPKKKKIQKDDEVLERDLYKIIADNSSDLISILSFEVRPKYIYVNPAHYDRMGYKPEELIAKVGLSVVHPDDRLKLATLLKKYLKDKVNLYKKQNKKPWHETFSYRVKHKNGTWRYLKTTADLVNDKILLVSEDVTDERENAKKIKESDEKAKPMALQGTTANISKEKELIGELSKQNELIKNIIENIGGIFYIRDIDQKITFVSPQCKDIMGYTQEEMKRKWTEISSDNPINEEAYKITEKALKTGKKQSPYILEVVRKDKKKIWVEINESPIKDEEGKVVGMTGVVIDINEKHNTEEDLKLSHEKFKIIFDNAPDAIYITDLKGVFVDGNKVAEKLMGGKKEDLIGKNMFKIGMFNKKDFAIVAKIMAMCIKGKATGPDEVKIKNKNGELVSVEVNTFPIKLKGKKHILGTARDITERKIQEKKIFEKEKSFKKLFETSPVGMFIYELIKGKLILTDSNKACDKLLGADIGKMHGLTIEETFPKLKATPIHANFKRVAKEGGVYRVDSVEYKENGIDGIYEVLAFQLDQGKIVVMFDEISGNIIAERKIQDNEKFLNTIFESATDAVFVKNEELVYTHANSRTEKLLGKPMKEIIGKKDEEILGKENSKYNKEIDKRVLRGEFIREQIAVKNKNNNLYFHITKLPLRNTNNKIIGICGYAHDITEMVNKERELKSERDKVDQYLELLDEIVVALDTKGRIIRINKKGCEILGYEEKELLGKNWFKNFISDRVKKETFNVFNDLVNNKNIENYRQHENSIKTKSGKEEIIAWNNTILRDEEGNIIGTLSSGQIVTESKRIEKESDKRTKELEKFNKLMIGREIKMVELKRKVKELEYKLNNSND